MNAIQKKILSIYLEIKKICEKHDICFFAIGGTCIGAVRHKGFIPWDDDLDIAIPIEQYELFLEYAKKELPPDLLLMTCDNCKHYKNLFVKIHDSKTTYIEKSEIRYTDAHKGIFVDVMPISGIPDIFKEKIRFQKKIQKYHKWNYIHRFSFMDMYSNKMKFAWLVDRLFCWWRPYNYFTTKWIKLLTSQPLKKSNLTGYVWSQSVSEIVVDTSYFSDVVLLPFEEASIPCPIGYNQYLTKQFGDYMTLPAENQRKSHNAAIISVEKSYKKQK